MKKITTFILTAFTTLSFAQGPIIEGTYLPVAGTKIKEAWVTAANTLSVPATGTNVVWNYSTSFANTSYTNEVATGLADTTKYHGVFSPKTFTIGANTYTATHAVHVRVPYNGLPDSTYNYLIINKKGLYNVGSYIEKKMYDSTIINTIPELLVPDSAKYGMVVHDSSRYIGYAKKVLFPLNGLYYKALIRGVKVKDVTGAGYGTLILPNATYNDVLLAKSVSTQKDSVYLDYNGNGNYFDDYIFTTPTRTLLTQNSIDYYFVRNNTFGSSYCAWIQASATNTAQTGYGWYSLPVDTGTIKGTVFTNSLAVANATAGVAYLYREASNFAKDDILATTPLDANGNYQFNSIPYGVYRIAIRPDVNVYPNAFITYYGDATDWLLPQTGVIQTFGTPSYSVGPIHLQYYPVPVGQGTVTGNCPGCKVTTAGIPGVGLIIKKKPGNAPIMGGPTDNNGNYAFTNLDNGQYELLVDRPGLYMSCTYTFEINGATTINGLMFAEGTTSISATNTVTNAYNTCLGGGSITTDIANQQKTTHNLLSVFPNPYQGQTTIKVTLTDNENVSLEVFNSLGQKVQTLDNSDKQAGEYKYQFSAKNLNLSNGLYFIKLKTNHQQQIIKLIEQ